MGRKPLREWARCADCVFYQPTPKPKKPGYGGCRLWPKPIPCAPSHWCGQYEMNRETLALITEHAKQLKHLAEQEGEPSA